MNEPRKMLILFSHTLLPDQEADVSANWGVTATVYLPQAFAELWSNVPPDAASVATHIAPVLGWLRLNARPGDLVLVQGDFGATWLAVNEALKLGAVPVYATTARCSHDVVMGDGSVVKTSTFRHVRFRRYVQED